MQIKFQKKDIPIYLSIFLNILMIIVVYFQLTDNELNIYINSDTLYLPSFFRDLFYDKAISIDWVTPAANCFFPDLVLFFIVHLFTSNFIVAMFVTGIIMNILLLLGFYLVIKTAIKDIPAIYCSFGINLLLLFHFAFLFTGDYFFTFYLTIINYHMGAFIASLYSMFFVIRFLKSNNHQNLIYAGIIYAFVLSSDFLTIFYLTIPLLSLSLLLLKQQSKKLGFWILITNVISFSVGFLIYRGIILSGPIDMLDAGYLTFNFSRVWESYRIMLDHHFKFIKALDIRSMIFVLSIISFLLSSFILVKRIIAFLKYRELPKKEILETIFLLLIVTQTIATYNAPAINGLYLAPSLFRYNVYVFFITILNYSYLVYKLSLNQNITKYIRGFSTLILVIFLVISIWQAQKVNFKEGKRNLFNYYPEDVKGIDNLCSQHNLKFGLSSYWVARKSTMLSREGVRIYQTHSDLNPYTSHVVNRTWYFGSRDGKVPAPNFNFIVPDNLNDSLVFHKLENHILDTLQSGNVRIVMTDPFTIDRTTIKLVFIE